MGHLIPSKTAAIEDALDRATVRLGIYKLIANIIALLINEIRTGFSAN